MVETYARLVQNIYEDSGEVCVVGVTDGFEVGVGFHRGSTLSPFLFALVVVDRLTDEVRQSERREHSLPERRRYVLQRRSKTK